MHKSEDERRKFAAQYGASYRIYMKAKSYTHLRIKKTYIASNSETYISLGQQDLRSCKKIGYEFYCEELFVVKHKPSYSCESAYLLQLDYRHHQE